MKRLFLGLSLLNSFIHTALVMAADPVRVKCGSYIMNVPSENVNCYQIDFNIPVSDTATPEEIANAQVANTAIQFSDYMYFSGNIPPEVTFYRTEDFANTSFDLVDISMSVSDMVINIESDHGWLEENYNEVPFMPYQAEERLAAALPAKIDFENGSGIRTIAVFQDPIQSASGTSNLYYSYQGISEDGNVYVSAVFPLRSMSLNGQSPSSVDWGNVTGEDFQPSLAELDYYVASIVIE